MLQPIVRRAGAVQPYRKAVPVLQGAHPDWFEVEWLPAYAPELNAVEMVWNHSDCGVPANFIPGTWAICAGQRGHRWRPRVSSRH